jgi:hypothetical protein
MRHFNGKAIWNENFDITRPYKRIETYNSITNYIDNNESLNMDTLF